ncbi:MAG: hypothetical protein SPK30_05760, partial [Candidatus Cryptobacteroides sp.]|nr:hypothetical protein [Bacteroidales bacterium]MDY5744147.1 hypothetical protein [Candidatus Cryptobacteroides sp.]
MTGPEKFHSIFARNCEIRRIDKAQASAFLNAYHRYGDCAAACRYGIFVSRYSGAEGCAEENCAEGGCAEGDVGNWAAGVELRHPYPIGTLVAVATFSKARRWTKDDADGEPQVICSYEWLRYASLPEVRVLGGMGRVLARFIGEHHPDDIMTYGPLRHFSGEVYESLGFVCEGVKI